MAIATAYSSVISHYYDTYLSPDGKVLEFREPLSAPLRRDEIEFVFHIDFSLLGYSALIYDRHSSAPMRDRRSPRDVLCGDLSLYTRPLDERLTSRRDNLPTWRVLPPGFYSRYRRFYRGNFPIGKRDRRSPRNKAVCATGRRDTARRLTHHFTSHQSFATLLASASAVISTIPRAYPS